MIDDCRFLNGKRKRFEWVVLRGVVGEGLLGVVA